MKLLDSRFAWVFEEGDEGQDKLRERLEEDDLGAPNFRPKKDMRRKSGLLEPGFIPLQAADMLAYEISLAAQRQNYDRWACNEFMQMLGRIGIFLSEDIQGLQRDLRTHGPYTPMTL